MESMISDWKDSKRYVIDSESVVISTDRVRCGIRELASPRRALSLELAVPYGLFSISFGRRLFHLAHISFSGFDIIIERKYISLKAGVLHGRK